MNRYRRTSRCVAVTVPLQPDVEPRQDVWHLSFKHFDHSAEAKEKWFKQVGDSMETPKHGRGQPWWWLVGIHNGKDDAEDSLPWDVLVSKFKRKLSEVEKGKLVEALTRTSRDRDDFGIDNPKVQTVELGFSGEVVFRAMPQGRCDNRTRPPRASFLPRVLPAVTAGECVLELCQMRPSSEYKLVLFNISDSEQLPKVAPKPLDKGNAKTAPSPWEVTVAFTVMKVACVLAMVVAIARHVWAECTKVTKRTNYSQVFPNEQESVSGFHQVKVRHLFVDILKDLLRSSTMFLPIIGPIGLVLASDVVIGTRVSKVLQSREEYSAASDNAGDANHIKDGRLWQFAKDIWNLILNIFIIPWNIYTVQVIWATYFSHWYSKIHMDLTQDKSFGSLQQYGYQWQEVSGLELGGWVPGVVLSTFILALEQQNDIISAMLQKHRKRAETHLSSLAKGQELWTRLCKMDSRMFSRKEEAPDLLCRRFLRLAVSIVFGLLPHLWMCVRHGVPLWNGPMMWVTLMYLVNISGVSTRFLALSDRIDNIYRRSCMELETFQALSWQEDTRAAIYDPFATRNRYVMEARKKLRENVPRIGCLKLEEPEDSKVWWQLRELVFIQLKDGRILMEMMVLVIVYFGVLLGLSSIFVMTSLKEITAITIVTAVVMVVLLGRVHSFLRAARDINLMAMEHTCLLHSIVAEMNMPLRPQMPLDSHLQQERFLLQVATLIEKQPQPETIASFTVTPQLFSLVVGTLGILTAISLYNLVNGLINLHPASA